MVSKLEQKIRNLDDQGLSRKKIAEETGASIHTVNCYLLAKRKMCDSWYKLQNDYLLRRKNKKFMNRVEQSMAHRRGCKTYEELERSLDLEFYRYHETNRHREIEQTPILDENYLEAKELAQQLYPLLEILKDRELDVIKRIFLLKESQPTAGKSLGISTQRVQQIKDKALQKLYPIFKQKNLQVYLE